MIKKLRVVIHTTESEVNSALAVYRSKYFHAFKSHLKTHDLHGSALEAHLVNQKGFDWGFVRSMHIEAATQGFSLSQIFQKDRGPVGTADLRMKFMHDYARHSGKNATEIGEMFGRDRTTVLHAISLVKDLEDNDQS